MANGNGNKLRDFAEMGHKALLNIYSLGASSAIERAMEGRAMEEEAQKALDEYERQPLENVYENLQISTMGAELAAEEAARTAATSIDALGRMGARGVVGGVTNVQKTQQDYLNRIKADLDERQKQLDYVIAGDEAYIRGMQEQREREELQGYGQQLATGRQDYYGGMGQVGQIAGNVVGMMASGGVGGFVNPANTNTTNYQTPFMPNQQFMNYQTPITPMNPITPNQVEYTPTQATLGGYKGN